MVFSVYFYSKIIVLLLVISSFSLERCKSIEHYIRDAHYFYFGIDFPYWYSVAQAEKESLCRHNVLSYDGVGSEGFAQITHKIWERELDKQGITEIKSLKNHAKAQAYINYRAYKESRCKKLFEMYQIYNGGKLVSKEISNSCSWEYGYKVCKRKNVCVYFKDNVCLQFKNACDINYSYSVAIYRLAQKYRKVGSDGKYKYW